MNKPKVVSLSLLLGLPILFALLSRLFFGNEYFSLYDVMSVAFIVFVPMAVGALTIYFSSIESVKHRSYRVFMPWVPVAGFFVVTVLLQIEGWGCWIMIMPVFLLFSSIGGLIAGYYKLRKKDDEKMLVSLITLLPFLISPLEQAIAVIPGRYEAYTSIDIHASKENIWNNVTRVRAINQAEKTDGLTHFLEFPRPIKAELNYEGVGAFRKAVFDKGLVFDETVQKYEPQKKMVFSIKANPYDIPSTTMDKHIVVGGQYFDVLNGTYELEQLDDSTCRLHLYSHYKLTTTFNFYASWWAGWIMKDIQNNILRVIKQRAEGNKN